MLLKRLTLDNFGLFRGTQTIDLLPRVKYGRQRNVILIGGHNGAGKSTILEAIRLCLYGRLALGNRVGDAEYDRHLRERIHRDRASLVQPTSASIKLEFAHSRSGVVSNYLVERSWEAKGQKSVSEQLSILCNDKPIKDVEAQLWSDFIRSLIPPGLSQLFFFDGEKIQRLAEDETESGALAEAVKALLGLDLVERLKGDLDVYVGRAVRDSASEVLTARIQELESKITAHEAELERLNQEEAHHQAQLEHLAAKVEEVELNLAQKGGGIASKRDEHLRRQGELAAARDQVKKALQGLFEGPLPFAASPILNRDLLKQLETEADLERWQMVKDESGKIVDQLSKHLTAGQVAKKFGWSSDTKKELQAVLKAFAEEHSTPPDEVKSAKVIHGLSPGDRGFVARTIELSRQSLSELSKLTEALIDIEARAAQTNSQLKQVPAGEEISPLVKELSRLQEKRGFHEAERMQRVDAKADLQKELAKLRRDLQKDLDKHHNTNKTNERLRLASRVRSGLDLYLERLTQTKVAHLERVVAECFGQLCRKPDLVSEVRISPENFKTTLIGKGGKPMRKADLSAGEKQIYAISLLWALGKVSGRPLPLIIDTPLGRLDSHHRMNLVERYFPLASHQVVILSTDTEIDRALFKELRSATSHSINLVNHSDGWTESDEGYFWKDEDDAAA